MANYYVHPLAGKDTNSGTSWESPYASLTKALSVATNGADIVHVGPGIVFGGNYTVLASGILIKCYGTILNCTGYDYFIYGSSGIFYVQGAMITGFAFSLHYNTSYPGPYFKYTNCTIYQKGSLKDVTSIVYGNSGWTRPPHFYSCLCWGVKFSTYTNGACGYGTNYLYNNIIVTTVHAYAEMVADCNASNQAGLRGTNGWDVATYPIPVYSEDADSPDLRFNPGHAQFSKYAEGAGNRMVGHTSRPTVSFSDLSAGFSFSDNRAWGTWSNDDKYYNESFPEVIVDSTTNKYIDFDEGGSELNGSVADGTYSTSSSMMTAVAVAMNAVATATITCGVADSLRSTIATDSTELNLLPNTGTNSANSIYEEMGFDTTADCTGQTLYTSDDPMTVGPVSPAPSNAAPVTVASDKIVINATVEPNGKSGRAISPVIDLFRPEKLKRVYVSKIIDGLGEIDNSGSDSTREIEIRADDIIFDKDDASATTDLDWTMVEYDGLEDADKVYRYWQVRLVVRLDKVS